MLVNSSASSEPKDHVAAAPQRGMHVAGARAAHHRQRDPHQQRHIRPFAQRQVTADEHHHAAPSQHQRQRIEFQIQGDQAGRGAEHRAGNALQRPLQHVAPKRIGPITTTRVISGQVPSGTASKRISRKVRINANPMRTPWTMR